jgi:hypothetical protein
LASEGHQSLHITRWLLLETKEEDFGCQFVLTLCKVCLRQRRPYTDPNQCTLFSWMLWPGADGGPPSEMMGNMVLVPFVSQSPPYSGE